MYKRGYKTWCENTALNIRHRLKLKSVDPLDLQKLASHVGAKIIFPEQVPKLSKSALKILTEKDPDSWSAVTIRVADHIIIVLNSAHSQARQMSSLAHELAHLIVGHAASQTGISQHGLLLTSFDRQQEDEASWLAGCLLLPREVCLHIRRRRMAARASMAKYGVSSDMLNFRMNASGAAKEFQSSLLS
jgi:Zn-dependent peptidase ImmA (M78 family)